MDRPETYRRHAIAGGIFFIIATVFLFIGEAFYGPILSDPNVLDIAGPARTQVATGLLLEYVCILAIPLIAIALYPALKQVSPALAIGYIVFRALEAAILTQPDVDRMFVVELSEALLATPSADADTASLVVQALLSDTSWAGTNGPLYNLVFVVGMLMLNWVLWTSRLVPRLISGWGLVSACVHAVLSVTAAFGPVPDMLAITLIAPLAIQEMVLAVWLIAKGLDTSSLQRGATATAGS